MINLKSLIEESVKGISPQQAIDNKFFGPVWHGTTSDKREKIGREGFEVFFGHERSGDVSHGYEISDYSGGIPAPIHHLGFGVYFTTVLSIAKQFSGGSGAGLVPYYLNVPHLETINFGSPNNMMKWWLKNGYDYKITPQTRFGNPETDLSLIREERMRATQHLTEELSSRYDAVWFKGKGIRRLLDGDQVCVYDVDNIYMVDKSLIKPGEVGSKVISKVGIDPYGRGEIKIPIGTKGTVLKRYHPNELQSWAKGEEYIYEIKWAKGGKMYNVLGSWIKLL